MKNNKNMSIGKGVSLLGASILLSSILLADNISIEKEYEVNTPKIQSQEPSLPVPDKKVLNSIFSIDEESEPDILGVSSSDIKEGTNIPFGEASVEKEDEVTEEKTPPCVIDVSSLGKGSLLTEKEIDKALLDFVLEEEQKKQQDKKEADKIKKEMVELKEELGKVEAERNKMEVALKQAEEAVKSPKKLSIEEQKRRLSLGLSQFGDGEMPDGDLYVPPPIKIIEPLPTIFGVSCISYNCVAISDRGVLKIGDFIRGEEKILHINRKRIKTTEDTIDISVVGGDDGVSGGDDEIPQNSTIRSPMAQSGSTEPIPTRR